jgi:hypothetical protein
MAQDFLEEYHEVHEFSLIFDPQTPKELFLNHLDDTFNQSKVTRVIALLHETGIYIDQLVAKDRHINLIIGTHWKRLNLTTQDASIVGRKLHFVS